MRDYILLISLALTLVFAGCSSSDDDSALSTSLGSITASRTSVCTGQVISFSINLPECIQHGEGKVKSAYWVVDGSRRVAGTLQQDVAVLTDTLGSETGLHTYKFCISFTYDKEYDLSAETSVQVSQADVLNSVWGETPQQTMLSVPVSINYQTGRYEYYEEHNGVKDINSLWSYEYVNNMLCGINYYTRKYNETDSVSYLRYLTMYEELKRDYGMPVESDDALAVEMVLGYRTSNDSLYSYCLNLYGASLHSGEIMTSDTTTQKFSLCTKFVGHNTQVCLYAFQDTATVSRRGVMYSKEYKEVVLP